MLDVATGRVTASLEEANELPVLAFSPDGTRLAGVNRRNGGYPHISIWKTTTGQKLLDLALTLPKRGYLDGGIRRLEFSPDGHRLTVYGVVGVDYKAWKKEWDATPRSGAAR